MFKMNKSKLRCDVEFSTTETVNTSVGLSRSVQFNEITRGGELTFSTAPLAAPERQFSDFVAKFSNFSDYPSSFSSKNT